MAKISRNRFVITFSVSQQAELTQSETPPELKHMKHKYLINTCKISESPKLIRVEKFLPAVRCKVSGSNYTTFVIRYEISAFAILFSLANSLSPKQYRWIFLDIFRRK